MSGSVILYSPVIMSSESTVGWLTGSTVAIKRLFQAWRVVLRWWQNQQGGSNGPGRDVGSQQALRKLVTGIVGSPATWPPL